MTEPTSHLIRKYANRKLYDTTTSRYVTLAGIWDLVCSGHDVRVVEHGTGNDITAVVLSQIVASNEKTTAIEKTPEAAEAAEVRRDTLLDYLLRTLGRSTAAVGDEVGRRGTEFAAALQDRINRRGELAAELIRRRTEVEDAVETAVSRAMESFNFTSRRDVSHLRRRVDELEKRVAKVQAELQRDLEARGAANPGQE
ncbi:MAG: phasin family protein [Candidatus Dormibacteraeota bacterium]|nr:phasin family protein [Candidatus Dormibacteraeota bacterium]